MNRFLTLLQREWMQHQRGWIILLALPLVVALVVALFGNLQLEFDRGEVLLALPAVMLLTLALTCLTLLLTWTATLLMAPGLARRDVQDRSIEFWVSLPTSHSHSLGATLLMHLVALPLAAIGVGALGAIVLSPLVVSKGWGIAQWFALPWGQLLLATAALMLRVALGVVLATLWLSPLILGTMAASAWLKRWGVPVVAGAIVAGGVLLEKLYGITWISDALHYLGRQALGAMAAATLGPAPAGLNMESPDQFAEFLPSLPGWLLTDGGQALVALASPGFIAALAAGAAGFALLVWRRQRGM